MESKNRDKFIKFRVTEEEKAQIRRNALSAYMLPSDYLREIALGHKIINKDGFREFVHALNDIGNNLNQLTILSHQGKVKYSNLENLRQEVANIWQLLNLRL